MSSGTEFCRQGHHQTIKFHTLKIHPLVPRFIRFGIVGFTGFLVDFSITWILRDIAGLTGSLEYLANAIGFTFGATSNYILNRRWTWRSDNPDIKGEFARFFGVSLVGLGINTLVIWACLNLGNMDVTICGTLISDFWVAKFIATGVVMIWNFFVNNYFTFKQR